MGSPLFILSPPRHFSSVVSTMIGQHPQLYGLPEVRLFWSDTVGGLSGRFFKANPKFPPGLLRAIAELGLGAQEEADVRTARQWLLQQTDSSTATVFNDLVEWAAPRRLVDKNPIYPYSMEAMQRILKAYPSAYFLHLLRHPTAVASSFDKAREEFSKILEGQMGPAPGFGGKKDVMLARKYAEKQNMRSSDVVWLLPHRNIMTFLEHVAPNRQLRLRGEDILAEPDKQLKVIAKWLGISATKADIESMKHPEQSPFAKFGPKSAQLGNDPIFLKDPALRPYKPKPYSLDVTLSEHFNHETFGPETRELAASFGYQ